MLDAIDDFLTWIDGKRKHGLDVDFVLGNHDMQYLRGIPGPGTHTDLYKEVSEALTYMKVCDTFSLTPHLIAVGDGSMLLVEGTSARVVTSEELGLESWDMASWNWMDTYVLPFL